MRFLIKSVSLLVMVMAVLPCLAQPGGSPLGGGPAPIDGGVGILLAAGAGYGLKKIRDAKKEKNKQ